MLCFRWAYTFCKKSSSWLQPTQPSALENTQAQHRAYAMWLHKYVQIILMCPRWSWAIKMTHVETWIHRPSETCDEWWCQRRKLTVIEKQLPLWISCLHGMKKEVSHLLPKSNECFVFWNFQWCPKKEKISGLRGVSKKPSMPRWKALFEKKRWTETFPIAHLGHSPTCHLWPCRQRGSTHKRGSTTLLATLIWPPRSLAC